MEVILVYLLLVFLRAVLWPEGITPAKSPWFRQFVTCPLAPQLLHPQAVWACLYTGPNANCIFGTESPSVLFEPEKKPPENMSLSYFVKDVVQNMGNRSLNLELYKYFCYLSKMQVH